MDLVASISVRENERGMHIGAGWNPNYHQPTDTVDKIDWAKLTNAAKLYYMVALELANKTERPLISRPALHAEQLALTHPQTGEMVTIAAPWPKELNVAVKYLRRYGAGR